MTTKSAPRKSMRTQGVDILRENARQDNAKASDAATAAAVERRATVDIRALGQETVEKYGALANVLAAVKRAQDSVAKSDASLEGWHALALTAKSQKVTDRDFATMVPGATKHTLPRLVKGATLAAKYRAAGFAVSPGKCQTFADRATATDMAAALSAISAKSVREGSDPVALGVAKAKGKGTATGKGTAKGKTGSDVSLTIKPEQFGAALDIILARVGDIPAKQKSHALETARAIVDALAK